jgi:hypothetical protein
MIRTLFNIMGFASPKIEVQEWSREDFEEVNYRLNDNIEILSKYLGALGNNHRATYLDIETSRSICDGDMVVIGIAYSHGVAKVPKGFKELIHCEHKHHPNLLICYKQYKVGDPKVFRIFKHSENVFISALTLRGADIVVDAAGSIDTACGDQGLAFTPRVKTAQDGCLISMFAYGDPHKVLIKNQINLGSLANDGKGFALGVSPTDGGMSKRIKAISDETHKGNGNDIAVAISFY